MRGESKTKREFIIRVGDVSRRPLGDINDEKKRIDASKKQNCKTGMKNEFCV